MSMMIHRAKQRGAKKNNAPLSNYENNTNEEPLPFTDNDITFETEAEEQKYTRTDINRMNKDDLVSLAVEAGIENAEDMSGNELKKELIEKFEL